ncbi:hypothetical protein [Pontibacter brevis]
MKRIWISMVATMFMGTSVMMTSCGGNNGDMPPETTTGETQETGIEDPASPMGTTTGDTVGTYGTTAGGTTAGTTAGGTTTGTTAGGTTTGGGTTAGGTTAGGATTGTTTQ